ncbi:hypothetical protein ACJX0J_021561 [Zea mays]
MVVHGFSGFYLLAIVILNMEVLPSDNAPIRATCFNALVDRFYEVVEVGKIFLEPQTALFLPSGLASHRLIKLKIQRTMQLLIGKMWFDCGGRDASTQCLDQLLNNMAIVLFLHLSAAGNYFVVTTILKPFRNKRAVFTGQLGVPIIPSFSFLAI